MVVSHEHPSLHPTLSKRNMAKKKAVKRINSKPKKKREKKKNIFSSGVFWLLEGKQN